MTGLVDFWKKTTVNYVSGSYILSIIHVVLRLYLTVERVVGYIGGDTHTAGAAIAAPLQMLGQQRIQNVAPSQTMFVIFIDPFCCSQSNQTSRLRILH